MKSKQSQNHHQDAVQFKVKLLVIVSNLTEVHCAAEYVKHVQVEQFIHGRWESTKLTFQVLSLRQSNSKVYSWPQGSTKLTFRVLSLRQSYSKFFILGRRSEKHKADVWSVSHISLRISLFVSRAVVIYSFATGKKYYIQEKLSCNAKNVTLFYLATCNQCSLYSSYRLNYHFL